MPTPETPSTEESTAPPEESTNAAVKWLSRLVRLALVAAILAGASGIAYHWMTNRPKAQRRPQKTEATLVEVTPVTSGPERIVVGAFGTVVPATEVQLAARVSGQVVKVSPHLAPGSHFAKDELILAIDPADYELAVKQREADLVQAESSLRLEMGQQSIAKREYELLGKVVKGGDEGLLLREPQLDSTKATIAAAKAALEKARLDLRRTTIQAPFNAVVQARNVDLGSYVGSGTPVATLVGVDEYWVEVTVPVDEIRWLAIPGTGDDRASEVRIFHESAWGAGAYREGKVLRLMTDLQPDGKMAQLLVTVPDPLHRSAPDDSRRALILGLTVSVEVEGDEIPDVVRIPRTALHEGAHVWVMGDESTLEIRTVQIVWGSEDEVLVSDGLADGDLLVTSDLAAPVSGMALRTGDAPAKSPVPPATAEVPAKEQP